MPAHHLKRRTVTIEPERRWCMIPVRRKYSKIQALGAIREELKLG